MKGETYTAQVVDELTALAASERSRADRLEQDLKVTRDAMAALLGDAEKYLRGVGKWDDWLDDAWSLLASVEENRSPDA